MALPDSVRFPLVLAVLAAIAGGGLAFVQMATRERVSANKQRKLNAAFGEIPGYASSRELKMSKAFRKEHKYTKREKCFELLGADGQRIGYAAQVRCVKPPCYNSTDPMVLVVAVDPELKKVQVVRTVSNNETPGLGSKISREKPSMALLGPQPREDDPKYPFLFKFADRPTDKLERFEKESRGDKSFDAVTGATVSSKAVLGGVRRAVELIRKVVAAQ
jgi:RnfABCDGE-type electron transport complex G subunit